MCINFNGYHSGGSTFVNVNDCWLLQKLFVYHIYKFSLEKEKKKNKESQYMVSHPENGSDSPIGSDRDRGRDIISHDAQHQNVSNSILVLIGFIYFHISLVLGSRSMLNSTVDYEIVSIMSCFSKRY